MINRIALTISLLMLMQLVVGQDFNLSFTQKEKKNKKTSSIIKSVTKNDKLYAVKYIDEDKLELSIRSCNDLKVSHKRMIIGGRKTTDQVLGDNFKFTSLVRLDKRIYLLVQSFEKSEQKNVLMAQEINDTGDFVGKLKVIEEIKVERKSNIGGFGIDISTDTTKLLVISSPPYQKKQNDQFRFKTLNSELKSVSKIGVELPHSDKDFVFHQSILTRTGSIVFSGYYKVDGREAKRDYEEEKMVVYIVEPSGELKDFEVSIPKLELTNINIAVGEDDNVLWVNGLYRNLVDVKKDEIHGIASVKINIADKKVISKKIAPFSKSLIAKARDEHESKVKDHDGISPYYRVKDYLPNNDGTMWALVEKKYSVTNKYGTTYFFSSIIALFLNDEGAIQQSIFIPKRQVMGYKSYSIGSFYTYHNGQRLFLVLNDHKDNVSIDAKNEKDCKQVTNANKSNLFAFELLSNGSFTKRKLFDNAEMICLVDMDVDIDTNTILFEVCEYNLMGIPKNGDTRFCRLNIQF